jgi:hypothetical protein
MTLGKRSAQRSLFGPDAFLTQRVREDSFYGFLASQQGKLFNDDEFADLYKLNNGRPSVPPSLLATALVLQTYDRVSDAEAKQRAEFDIRWKVALGVPLNESPFAKSTLQLFRSQLILHGKLLAYFEKSVAFARQMGHLKGHKIQVVLDTSFVFGRGANKDTYNLLGAGIVKLIRVLARLARRASDAWSRDHGLGRYFDGSLKGEAGIDWEDVKARAVFLSGVVADADRLLEMARENLTGYEAESAEHKRLIEASNLLGQLLLQDIDRTAEGVSIKKGTARNRVVSVDDPEMRHGHKSATKRFNGHKIAIAVDPESQIITAVDVLPGNAPDCEHALDLVKQSEASTKAEVDEVIGDCAYGAGATRQEFRDAGIKLVAKVPNRPNGAHFAKQDFQIDPVAKTCVCPAGNTCSNLVKLSSIRVYDRVSDRVSDGKSQDGKSQEKWGFRFDRELCASCALRPQCVKSKSGQGRTVSLHPQEAILQDARAFQQSEEFAPYRKSRQVAEHRLARLMQLGMRQARYFGRVKTRCQSFLTAMVANLTLVARSIGLMRKPRSVPVPAPVI